MDVALCLMAIVLVFCLLLFVSRVVDVTFERPVTIAGDLVMIGVFAAFGASFFFDMYLEAPLWSLVPLIVFGTLGVMAGFTGLFYVIRNGATIGRNLADRLGHRFREMLRDRRENDEDRN